VILVGVFSFSRVPTKLKKRLFRNHFSKNFPIFALQLKILIWIKNINITMEINKDDVISFEEFLESLGINDKTGSSLSTGLWHTYWEIHMQPLYDIEYWKFIDKMKIRDLLEDVLERFDFKGVESYMKVVNWTWQDQKKTPTIKNLKSCVIGLIGSICEHRNSNSVHNPSKSSTGGFEVSLYFINDTPIKIKTEFQKKDGTNFVEESKITMIRKKKLEAIERLQVRKK